MQFEGMTVSESGMRAASVEADLRFDPVTEQVGVVAGDEMILQLA